VNGELRRIRSTFEERDARAGSPADVALEVAVRARSEGAMTLLREEGLDRLGELLILDLGCGRGGEIQRLVGRGARPDRIVGVDLLHPRARAAAAAAPGAAFVVADAGRLPFDPGRFDLVLLYTVLSSILDPDLRVRVGRELARALRPGGAVLWYDFRWNPTNRRTVGIGPRAIARLLPAFRHRSRRVTLAPPLARPLWRHAPPVAAWAERVPALRSHTIGLAVKPEAG
jgi:SAM-dependent methyltransferase